MKTTTKTVSPREAVFEQRLSTMEKEHETFRDGLHNVREVAQVAKEVSVTLRKENMNTRLVKVEQWKDDFVKLFDTWKTDISGEIKQNSKEIRNLIIGMGTIIGTMQVVFKYLI